MAAEAVRELVVRERSCLEGENLGRLTPKAYVIFY